MFTLKLSPHDGPVGGGGDVSWITGVTEVHRIGQAMTSDYTQKWEGYLDSYPPVRNFASTGWVEDATDYRLTLLTVRTVRDEFYAIAELAWLLGPDGDTVERVAP